MPKDISLLVDGELDQGSAEAIIKKLKDDEKLQHTWLTYHIIGDTLRQNNQLSSGFSDRFAKTFAQEPIIFNPQRRFNKVKLVSMSIAASLAAVFMVGGIILHSFDYKTENLLAWSKPTETKVVINRANNQVVKEYLIAHQEFSPSTMIQGVAPYARTVSNVSQDTAP